MRRHDFVRAGYSVRRGSLLNKIGMIILPIWVVAITVYVLYPIVKFIFGAQ